MPKDLIIAGAGGCGREVLQWVKDINKIEHRWNILGFINDIEDALDAYECDYSIIGKIEDWQPQDGQEFICAIGDPSGKELVIKRLKERGAVLTSVIHPTAYISEFTEMGEGLIMYPGSGINVNTKVGNFVTILSGGLGHDVEIGDYCTISSYCDIAGGAKLGKKVFLGSHVTVVPHKTIGDEVFAAAGSVIISNIKSGYHVMGNPAKRMEF